MSTEATFFRKRAEAEWQNADAADLANVRDRCVRAARSWDAMAEQSERIHRLRLEREAQKRVEPIA